MLILKRRFQFIYVLLLQKAQFIPFIHSAYNLPSLPIFYQVKEPAKGYPASTWPLDAKEEQIAQTYGSIVDYVFVSCKIMMPLDK